MSDALRYQKVKEAQEDFELAIRKLREACKDIGATFTYELSNIVYKATDREVCINEVVEDHD
jgi:hypothetical protein